MAKGGILIEALAPRDDEEVDDVLESEEPRRSPSRDPEALIAGIESRLAELRALMSEL